MLNRTAALVLVLLLLVASGCSDQPSLAGKSTTPSSESPTVQKGAFAELPETLAQVPDWAIADSDEPMILLRDCGAGWASSASGWAAGTIAPKAWSDDSTFPSASQASDATDRLIDNLESCDAVAWRTQPIAQTGAVLASSATGVAWIYQNGATVGWLQVPTTDGPPPLDVQVEVAELVADHIKTYQQQSD